VVLAVVALALLGSTLSALEEPTQQTAASLTSVPSVAATAPPSVEPEESVQIQDHVAVPRLVEKRLENAKDALRRDDLQMSVI
jgi:hypothetical protein